MQQFVSVYVVSYCFLYCSQTWLSISGRSICQILHTTHFHSTEHTPRWAPSRLLPAGCHLYCWAQAALEDARSESQALVLEYQQQGHLLSMQMQQHQAVLQEREYQMAAMQQQHSEEQRSVQQQHAEVGCRCLFRHDVTMPATIGDTRCPLKHVTVV